MTTTEMTRPNCRDLQATHGVREANRTRVHQTHEDECFLCGRGLTQKAIANGWWIHLHAPTGDLLEEGWEPTAPENWNDSQGCFPVGSECAKRIARPFKFKMEA